MGLLASTAPAFARRVRAAEGEGIQSLGGSLYLLSGLQGNVVARKGDDGLLLIDSGGPEDGNLLDQRLNALGGSVRTVVNTHYHLAHTGSNPELGRGGAHIIAHERTYEWMSTKHWLPRELRYEKAQPEAGHPAETFHDSHTLELGDETVELGHLIAAHTMGDIYAHFPQANVLVVGDVVSPEADPAFDFVTGGWIGGRRDALDKLLAMSDEDTRIVPGVGPVITRKELQAERDMIGHIYDRTVELVREGYGARDMLEAGVMDEIDRRFDEPYEFLYDVCKGLWAHHNKLAPNVV